MRERPPEVAGKSKKQGATPKEGLLSRRPWTVESDLTSPIFISCVPVRCKGEGKNTFV